MADPDGGGSASERYPSTTPDRAVLRQDNGEREEGVLSKDALDTADAARPGPADGTTVDEQSEASFPASDPPSHWAGEGPVAEDPRHGNV